jgi:hypothetical protein
MVIGRIVWGIAMVFLVESGMFVGRPMGGMFADGFTYALFISMAVTDAIPGIIVHLILIPAIVIALQKAGYVKFAK